MARTMEWTFLLALGVAAAFFVVLRRINFLEQELRRVESLLTRPDHRIGHEPAARIEDPAAPLPAPPPATPEPAPPTQKTEHGEPRFSLESLIGGRLPICF